MLLWNIPTGKGNARTIRDTIAIYMPQTLKFNITAEYKPAEIIGGVLGSLTKIKDAFNELSFLVQTQMLLLNKQVN